MFILCIMASTGSYHKTNASGMKSHGCSPCRSSFSHFQLMITCRNSIESLALSRRTSPQRVRRTTYREREEKGSNTRKYTHTLTPEKRRRSHYSLFSVRRRRTGRIFVELRRLFQCEAWGQTNAMWSVSGASRIARRRTSGEKKQKRRNGKPAPNRSTTKGLLT
jgi:hypothetical protein